MFTFIEIVMLYNFMYDQYDFNDSDFLNITFHKKNTKNTKSNKKINYDVAYGCTKFNS